MTQEIHNPFSFRDGDETLSFLIGEIFPFDDPLSRDLFRLLCADADLQALREIEESMPEPGSHSISQAKFEMRALFLVKLRLSFLWNALEEIILKQHPKRPELRSMLPKVSDGVVQCYDELRRTMRSFPRAQEIMSKFRNEASFHYDDAAVSKALKNLTTEKGEAIRNTIVSDMHLVVAYKIVDFIPAGLIEKAETKDLLGQVDQIQGKLHVFTFKFFIDYIQSRHLEQKIYAI